MAGVAGIEPANDGIKTRCLTTWLHPICNISLVIKVVNCEVRFHMCQTIINIFNSVIAIYL